MTSPDFVGLPDPTPYLLPEESVKFVVRRNHPIVLVPHAALSITVVLLVIAILLLSAPSFEVIVFGGLLVLAAVLYFGYRYLRWSRTVLVITNRRLFELVALRIRRVTVMPVVRQSITFRQSPLGRAMNIGTVRVETAGGGVLYKFDWVGDALRFRDEMMDLAA